ncbi:glucose transporter type 1-like isoform X2 [Liolophura sinensis]|uniref:glucose transporter type 1-like isoform X2 n=1 Tax=Liolophura sinensis TaxID=3198878 RepID=UPI003158019E
MDEKKVNGNGRPIAENSEGGLPGTKTTRRITLRLIMATFSAVMGSLQFGYNTGVINAPKQVIKQFLNESAISRGQEMFDEDGLTLYWSIIVSIFAIGGMIGGLLGGWWADFFGRKNGFLLNCVIGLGAGILMLTSRYADSYEMIIIGRLLIGINCGLYTGLTPIYLSEIAQANIRGALGTLNQLGVTVGILGSQIVGFPEVLGSESGWHILLGLAIIPCAVQVLTMPFCPDSPRYLLITKRREEAATKALRALRGEADVTADLDEIKNEDKAQHQEAKVSIVGLFKASNLRWPLLISIVMHLSQQFSGIVAVFYYSVGLFESAGLSSSTASYATSGVGAVMVVMTFITIPLMDRVGRRTLHLSGLASMFIFSLLITITLALRHKVAWFNIASIVMSLLYVASFALGPGSIPWLIVAELFSQGPRTAAISVSVLVNWVANFAVGFLYQYMQLGLGDYSFLPFTGLLFLFVAFLYKTLPETMNKSFEEISSSFKSGNKNVQNGKTTNDVDFVAKYTPTQP